MAKPKLKLVGGKPNRPSGWVQNTDHMKQPGDIVLGNAMKPVRIVGAEIKSGS